MLIILTTGFAIIGRETVAWIVAGVLLGVYLVTNAFLKRNNPEVAFLELRLRAAVARASEPTVSADTPDT
jgi:hypothetical protein